MASTRNGRHTEQVRYKGVSIAQTFDSKTTGAKWRGRVRAAIDEGRWPDRDLVPPHLWSKWGLSEALAAPVDDAKPHVGWTLDKALGEYKKAVTDHQKGWKQAGDRIAAWRARPVAERRLDAPDLVRELQLHIGERRAAGRAATTIRNEIFLISALFEHARSKDRDGTGAHGWGLAELHNPVHDLILPDQPGPRRRRLEDPHDDEPDGEDARLRKALLAGPDGVEMVALYTLAIETAMRQGEILDVRRGQVRRAQGITRIWRPDSKNGESREVFLSTRAANAVADLIALLPAGGDPDDRLFQIDGPKLQYRWRLARQAAKVKGLHWHDLRHEGLSRMANRGLNIGELQAQSGQRTTQVLAGYVNVKAAEISKKLG